jgi:hypothetical protein
MIRYALHCETNHDFESWFQSAEAFDRLTAAGMIACSVCGSSRVSKALMAPAVRPAGKNADSVQRPLATPRNQVEVALAALRRQVEENSEYVGLSFAAEARAIHGGEAPERSIYGEARADEARQLIEDGIPVAPLPFVPPRKAN